MLILFDMFETLVDGVHFDFQKALSYLRTEYFSNTSAEDFRRLSDEYYDTYVSTRSKKGWEYSFCHQLHFYGERLGVAVPNTDEVEWQAFQACHEEVVSKGAKELLSYLKQRGYTVAVLSNNIFSAATLSRYLQQFGLLQFIDKVYSSADMGFRKPRAEAFEFVLSNLHEVASPNVFFVGNDLEKDVEGAKCAGLTPVLINKKGISYDGISVANPLEFKQYLESNYLYVQSVLSRESLVDGPGLRTVVFLQGCDKHCKGCHNAVALPLVGGTRYAVRELAKILKERAQNKKITISGGEPLLQQKAVANLLSLLDGYDVCLYTGREEDDVPQEIKEKLHYLKTGDYREELRTTTKAFVGSSNQTFADLRRNK